MVNKTKIFVFGSNRQGRHGKGAALEAKTLWGAIHGQSEGLQGRSYAIITKELRKNYPKVTLAEVAYGVRRFLDFAKVHQEYEFSITPIGCGLAGFTPSQIAPLFKNSPENVKLPPKFLEILYD